ncbi:227 kDa spindle- and centromere-associated protein isoform X2 [Syngnathoides biaculeatus]|uniref:227 kDa spindle- and centromere-associated protein isoform X2 n=1 Tax=Syngnathoides biaculeatus TaxID=300417 RepID=UPI002ADD86C9|nr:227 kDa spindle- and centromere-associated protein isoform X2 [Syngnathoides biaculeatus]
MSRDDDDVTFADLLDLSFGTPRLGVVDLGSLRRLLLAIVTRLGIEQARGSELLDRIRTCEDGLAQALTLLQDVRDQTSAAKLRSEELYRDLASASLDGLKDAGVRLEARVDALEARKADGEQVDELRRLVRDADRREACRHLDERVRRHEDAIERLSRECRQLDDLREAADRVMSSLTSDKRGRDPHALGAKSDLLPERKMADAVRPQHEASISKLQRECDKLQEAVRRLHDDNKHKQVHIQQLLRTAEHLQENKADKSSLHAEVKHLEAERRNLRRSGGERRRSPEDSQRDAEAATAAGVRKQLLDTHRCLSCDRRVLRHLDAAYPPVSRSCGGATSAPRRRLAGRTARIA